jgi:hypothetical protein
MMLCTAGYALNIGSEAGRTWASSAVYPAADEEARDGADMQVLRAEVCQKERGRLVMNIANSIQ